NVEERVVQKIATLLGMAIPRLAFTNTGFARDLLAHFAGKSRERLVEAFAYQARRYGGGVFAGSPEDLMEQQRKQFAVKMAAFPTKPGLRISQGLFESSHDWASELSGSLVPARFRIIKMPSSGFCKCLQDPTADGILGISVKSDLLEPFFRFTRYCESQMPHDYSHHMSGKQILSTFKFFKFGPQQYGLTESKRR